MRAYVVALGVSLLVGCGGSSADPASRTGATGSDDEVSQVDRGAALYGASCASCHGADGSGTANAPPVVGEGALPLRAAEGAKRDVEFATAGDVFRWVRVAMPGDDPGSLSNSEYAAILAFALQANGVDMSGTILDEPAADAIRLH